MLADVQLMETEDSIEVNNMTFQKPFVEKPISAEDHNVYIYFPTSAGGGSQRLFRKVCVCHVNQPNNETELLWFVCLF